VDRRNLRRVAYFQRPEVAQHDAPVANRKGQGNREGLRAKRKRLAHFAVANNECAPTQARSRTCGSVSPGPISTPSSPTLAKIAVSAANVAERSGPDQPARRVDHACDVSSV
jgi:hypothetical protein